MSPLNLLTSGPDGEPVSLPIVSFTMVADPVIRAAPSHGIARAIYALCRVAGRGYEVTATYRDIRAASAEDGGQPVGRMTLIRALRWLESRRFVDRVPDPRCYSGQRIRLLWRRPQSLAEKASQAPKDLGDRYHPGRGGVPRWDGGGTKVVRLLSEGNTDKKEPGRSAVVGEAPPPAPARSDPDPGAAPMTPEELAAWRQSLGLPPPPPPEKPAQATPRPRNAIGSLPPSSAFPRDPEAELRRLRAWDAQQPPRPAPPCPAPTTEEPVDAGPDPPP
jgi:hypothetical protein